MRLCFRAQEVRELSELPRAFPARPADVCQDLPGKPVEFAVCPETKQVKVTIATVKSGMESIWCSCYRILPLGSLSIGLQAK